MKKETIYISIIIPVYNSSRTLSRCLQSVFQQECTLPYEVIVIDNNSTDNSREIATQYPVILQEEKKRGASPARNKGIKTAQGEIIVFLDSDCYAEKNWLQNLVEPLQQTTDIGTCGGNLLPAPPQNILEEYSSFRRILSQERVYKNERFSPPFFLTANLAVRHSILEDIQGFDEELVICEDADLCWRIQKKGWKLYYQKSAVVYHYHRTGFTSFLKQTFSYGYGYTLLFKKYRSEWNSLAALDIRPYLSIPAAFLRLPWTLLTGQGKISKIYPLFDIMSSAGFISGKIYGSIKCKVLSF